jgi:hypothetical protein
MNRDAGKGDLRNRYRRKAADSHQARGSSGAVVRIRLHLKIGRRLRTSLKETLSFCRSYVTNVCDVGRRVQVAQNHAEIGHERAVLRQIPHSADKQRLFCEQCIKQIRVRISTAAADRGFHSTLPVGPAPARSAATPPPNTASSHRSLDDLTIAKRPRLFIPLKRLSHDLF